MSLSNIQARRATVDDLVGLRKLWREAALPIAVLEKRLKEFQIVETPDGILLGGLGLQIEGQQGRLHSETCVKPEFEAEVRQRLWERAQTVARTCGLYRVWTDVQAPFWKSQGFERASPDLQKKLPASLGEPDRPWLVLKLRKEMPESISLDHEFELFTRAQRERTEQIIRKVQVLKNAAYLMLVAVIVIGLGLAVLAVVPGASRSRLFRLKTSPSPLAQPNRNTSTNSETSADPHHSAPAKPTP